MSKIITGVVWIAGFTGVGWCLMQTITPTEEQIREVGTRGLCVKMCDTREREKERRSEIIFRLVKKENKIKIKAKTNY